jgi:hypothetical protein
MENELRERVSRGAMLLDRERPDWAYEINLETLDLRDYEFCIVGQLWGRYSQGLYELRVDDEGELVYGFSHDAPPHHDEWAMLNEAWIDEIVQRTA